jgi:hypothetical protein
MTADEMPILWPARLMFLPVHRFPQAGRRPAKQLAAKLFTKDEARRIAANIAKI